MVWVGLTLIELLVAHACGQIDQSHSRFCCKLPLLKRLLVLSYLSKFLDPFVQESFRKNETLQFPRNLHFHILPGSLVVVGLYTVFLFYLLSLLDPLFAADLGDVLVGSSICRLSFASPL